MGRCKSRPQTGHDATAPPGRSPSRGRRALREPSSERRGAAQPRGHLGGGAGPGQRPGRAARPEEAGAAARLCRCPPPGCRGRAGASEGAGAEAGGKGCRCHPGTTRLQPNRRGRPAAARAKPDARGESCSETEPSVLPPIALAWERDVGSRPRRGGRGSPSPVRQGALGGRGRRGRARLHPPAGRSWAGGATYPHGRTGQAPAPRGRRRRRE